MDDNLYPISGANLEPIEQVVEKNIEKAQVQHDFVKINEAIEKLAEWEAFYSSVDSMDESNIAVEVNGSKKALIAIRDIKGWMETLITDYM